MLKSNQKPIAECNYYSMVLHENVVKLGIAINRCSIEVKRGSITLFKTTQLSDCKKHKYKKKPNKLSRSN